MTVNLTRIYTRLGDGGETHLGDMSRVPKIHPRVEAYGTVDELNAAVGLARLQTGMPPRFEEWLGRIQNDLLDLGADLCVPGTGDPGPGGATTSGDDAAPAPGKLSEPESPAPAPQGAETAAGSDAAPQRSQPDGTPSAATRERSRLRVTPEYTSWLELACDEVNDSLPPLRSFVIPGGSPAAAHLHVCRTVCRRAERRAIAVGAEVNAEAVRYLNRLSDLLFILARGVGEGNEALWEPGAHHDSSDSTSPE